MFQAQYSKIIFSHIKNPEYIINVQLVWPRKKPLIVIMVPLSESKTFINLLKLSPSSIGLSLSQATTMLGAIQWAVRQSSEAENYLTRLEKLKLNLHAIGILNLII